MKTTSTFPGRSALLAVLAAAFSAAPLAAQEQDVARGSFPYFERSLTIDVLAQVPGELQILRTRNARVEVAAMAAPGLASFTRGGWRGNALRLTAAGAARVAYIVHVPENVFVSVRTPDAGNHSAGRRDPDVIRWDGPPRDASDARPASSPAGGAVPVSLRSGPAVDAMGRFRGLIARQPPAVVSIPSLHAVRSLEVRIEGDEFAVATSRPLELHRGDARTLVLDFAGDPLDVVLTVPAGARLRLDAAGQPLLRMAEGRVALTCPAGIDQRPAADRRWLLYRPQAGRLGCD